MCVCVCVCLCSYCPLMKYVAQRVGVCTVMLRSVLVRLFIYCNSLSCYSEESYFEPVCTLYRIREAALEWADSVAILYITVIIIDHFLSWSVSRGFVQLRNWAVAGPEHGPRRPAKRRSAEDAKRLVKTKPCWFHHNHPQGCPRRFLEDSSCPYAHSSGDLRQRPDFSSTSEREVTFPTLTT